MEDVFAGQAQRTSFINQASQDYGRGRSMNEKQAQYTQNLIRKNPSSPSKIFRQYTQPNNTNKNTNSRSPFRNELQGVGHSGQLRENSEATSISGHG
jgi:hypothetical protein